MVELVNCLHGEKGGNKIIMFRPRRNDDVIVIINNIKKNLF